MKIDLSEKGILQAEILCDKNGDYGLYIIPSSKGEEMCITQAEMRKALQMCEEAQ